MSQEDKKLLGITTAPREPVLLACARACARLISSGRAATNEGKKEAEILVEAAGNADQVLGKKLAQAAHRRVGDFSFESTTVSNATSAITRVQSRVSLAVQSLNSYDASAARLIERYFEPFRAGGLDIENNPRTIAEIIALRLSAAIDFLTGKPFKQIFLPNIHGNVPAEVTKHFTNGSNTIAVEWFGTVYLHEDRFNSYNAVTHEAILLHEGMHTVLRAGNKEDQRYIWQGVEGLGVRKAAINADSYVAVVFDDVLDQIGRFDDVRG